MNDTPRDRSWTPFLAPARLTEADALLTAYGRWARDIRAPRTCGSAETSWRSTDVFTGVQVREVVYAFNREQTQQAMVRLPEIHRLRLVAWYVPRRDQHRQVRQAVRAAGGWSAYHFSLQTSLSVFDSELRRTSAAA